jgi:hypothetical protein
MSWEEEEEIQRGYHAEYIAWLIIEAKEIAATLKKLDPNRITEIIRFYENYSEHPASMHLPLEGGEEETIEELVGKDRLKKIILLKTKAFIFAPSILAPYEGSLDFGTAMYRRYPLHGLWFSVIALNEAYLKSASKSMLRYMLEHELAQSEIYAELARQHIKNLSLEMKGTIHEEARMQAIQWSCISGEEVEEERHLILELSAHNPVVPVHLASASLFRYLDENWEQVKQFGVASQNESEKEAEIPLEKLVGWSDFSISAFKIFLKELKRELTTTGAEYGIEIV